MGKKLQGAKLRAKKRARELVNEIQEKQSEQISNRIVSNKTNDDLFVLDKGGTNVPKHMKPTKKKDEHDQQNKKKKKLKHGLSEKDKESIQKILKKTVEEKGSHGVDKLKQMVKRDQRWCPNNNKDKPYLQNRNLVGKTKARFDLWNNNDNNNNNNEDDNSNKKTKAITTTTKTSSSSTSGTAMKKKAGKEVEEEKNKNDSAAAAAAASGGDVRNVQVGSTLGGIAPMHVAYKPKRRQKQQKQEEIVATNDDDDDTKMMKKKKKKSGSSSSSSVVAVDIANGGQSYHPDPVLHQNELRQAMEQELARQKAHLYIKTPISQGMSEETKKIIVGDSDTSSSSSDEEDSDSDDDDDDDDASLSSSNDDGGNEKDNQKKKKKKAKKKDVGLLVPVGPIPKRTLKLTKAQRNKKKRLRQEMAIRRNERIQKKFINSVSEIPRYKKEIKKEHEQLIKLKQKRLQDEHDRNKYTNNGKHVQEKLIKANPLHAPTWPVALPTHIEKTINTGALRQIKPKGNLCLERLNSYSDRKLTPGIETTNTTKIKKHALHHDTWLKEQKRKKGLSIKGSKNKQQDMVGKDFVIMGV